MQDINSIINFADRERIVELLEQYGFACYDSESTEELRDALRANVDDGTISKTEVESLVGSR